MRKSSVSLGAQAHCLWLLPAEGRNLFGRNCSVAVHKCPCFLWHTLFVLKGGALLSPALRKAGSCEGHSEGKRQLKCCWGICQLPLFLQWLPYQQCVGYQWACVHQTGLHSTLEFPTAFCSFESTVLVKACSAVSFLTPIWATRQFN